MYYSIHFDVCFWRTYVGIYKNNIIPKTNENKQQTEPIEYKLAAWLDSFDGHLEFLPNAQQHLHDCILSIDEQCYNKKESATAKAFLNASLSLTFLLKDNPDKVNSFIDYHFKKHL